MLRDLLPILIAAVSVGVGWGIMKASLSAFRKDLDAFRTDLSAHESRVTQNTTNALGHHSDNHRRLEQDFHKLEARVAEQLNAFAHSRDKQGTRIGDLTTDVAIIFQKLDLQPPTRTEAPRPRRRQTASHRVVPSEGDDT